MWTKLLKSSFVLGIFLIAVQTFAATDLTLADLRKEVLDENIDIRIQYEKYYQAQKNVSVALGEFLPSAGISLMNVNTTMAILQAVIPTPSDWFAYQSSKELKIAEKYTTESIKLNILEGLTINFIHLKHQESLMASMREQEKFLSELYEEARQREELGMASAGDVFIAKRTLMRHRQDIYALDTLMIAEKQALLIALNRSPDEVLTLGELPEENLESVPETVQEGIALALDNSTELVSNSYQAEAARYMVTSQRWSFISFNGIGFDYSSKLSIERSRARVIELQKAQITLKIKNQVDAAYQELALYDQRITIQTEILEQSRKLDQRNTELYRNGLISLSKFTESRVNLAAEERLMLKLQMERRAKIAQIHRLLGLDASLNGEETNPYTSIQLVNSSAQGPRNSSQFTFHVDASEEVLKNIFSVTYTVGEAQNSFRTLDRDSAFSYSFILSKKGTYKVSAKIKLETGDEIIKEDEIEVK